MAEASGLSRVAPLERDAVAASSSGTGELLRAALDAGARTLILGIGGSATTDGGAGLLQGLGATADRDRAVVDLAGLDPRLAGTELAVACDVSNPLLGATGAAAIYGPQKGASPLDVAELDRRLGGLGRRARVGGRRARSRHAGCRRRGRRRVRPACDRRPLPVVRASSRASSW